MDIYKKKSINVKGTESVQGDCNNLDTEDKSVY